MTHGPRPVGLSTFYLLPSTFYLLPSPLYPLPSTLYPLSSILLHNMPHEALSLDELAVQLGRDRRELEKLVQRGRIPGRRVDGEWRFHPAEIRMWLEQEIRGSTAEELGAGGRAQARGAGTP